MYAINSEEFKFLHATSSEETRDLGGDRPMPVFEYATNIKGELIVICSPVHDLSYNADPIEKIMCGGLSLEKSWNSIEKFLSTCLENTIKIMIPIGQSNSLYGISRNHWTLLSLTKNNKDWTAEFYDSKGSGGNLYNRQNMIEFLQKNLSTLSTLKMNFLGHQGLMNNAECGYFVAAYISALIQGSDINGLRTGDVQTTFDTLEEVLNTFQ